MAKELKKIYIDDIAAQTQTMLVRASKRHKSINAYCIFVEGDHFHVILPEYESEKEKKKATRLLMDVLVENKHICDAFAQFVVPPARYFERQARKQNPKT